MGETGGGGGGGGFCDISRQSDSTTIGKMEESALQIAALECEDIDNNINIETIDANDYDIPMQCHTHRERERERERGFTGFGQPIQEYPHTLQEMPITAVALKPCKRGSLRGAVTKGCAGLAPATAAVPGAFAAQDGTPTGYQKAWHQHVKANSYHSLH